MKCRRIWWKPPWVLVMTHWLFKTHWNPMNHQTSINYLCILGGIKSDYWWNWYVILRKRVSKLTFGEIFGRMTLILLIYRFYMSQGKLWNFPVGKAKSCQNHNGHGRTERTRCCFKCAQGTAWIMWKNSRYCISFAVSLSKNWQI